jgi:hypothetical protein
MQRKGPGRKATHPGPENPVARLQRAHRAYRIASTTETMTAITDVTPNPMAHRRARW